MNEIIGARNKAAEALVSDTTTANFARDVIDSSKRQPVLVDFWAPWCGPCRQLSPIIEEEVRAAKGKVRLVKMNIDDHPQIAGQLGIQSIPAVIAFDQGRPVDGFVGALPASQIKAFIDRVSGGNKPGEDIDAVLTAGEAALEANDLEAAGEAFSAVLSLEEKNLRALAGLIGVLLAGGELERAKELLASLPAEAVTDLKIVAVSARIALAEQTLALGDPESLRQRLAADPKDHQARFDLALIANAKGEREAAGDLLLEIIRRDRLWRDDGARKQLVQFFEAWGPADPATLSGRRRLSSLLFS